jgi:hypothetical protein
MFLIRFSQAKKSTLSKTIPADIINAMEVNQRIKEIEPDSGLLEK